jgi:hypothetical protein
MKLKISREMEVPLEATEVYIKKAFGLVVNLKKMFNFSVVAELLYSVKWTKALPVFIPQGVDNRQAVDSLFTVGFTKKPDEEDDVMKYRWSEGSDKPRLYLVNFSARPDDDTMGVSPNNLVKTGKLWLPLKGYAVAQGLYNQMTGEYLDQRTWTWFPGETLPEGHTADGRWSPNYGQVIFGWYYSPFEGRGFGPRLAIPVPCK